MLIAVLSGICSIGYCEKYEFEENYKLSYKNAWVTEESENYSGARALKLYTRNDSEVGYYVEYTVKTEESGAYQLSVDSTELGGNVYCDVFVSVNGGALYSLNANSGVGIPQSSGLTRWTIKHLPGFVAGNNTIRFTVTDSRLRDSLYIAYFDCFSLEKADFGIQGVVK